MEKYHKKLLGLPIIFALLAIVYLGNYLRYFSYATVPHPGETSDEYSFGWVGISLLRDSVPIGWSGLPAYKAHDFEKINVDQLFDKDPHRPLFSLDKPWFDHPPLFGLITGGYAYTKGIRNFEDASVAILRRPMLRIGIVTTILIFLLGRKLYNPTVGIVASLVYSVSPFMVISSRLALAENAFIPLFLASILAAIYYLDKRKITYWIVASSFAGLALLMKLSSVSIAFFLLSVGVVFGKQNRKELCLVTLLGAGVALTIFLLYGAYFGWKTFVDVQILNTSRFYGAGSEIFFQAVNSFKITTFRSLSDGWLTAGWISLFWVITMEWKVKKGGTVLALAVFSYFVVFLLFGSESYGWYKFPFLPFLAISLGRLIERLFQSANLPLFFGLILLPFGTTVHRLIGVEGFQAYVSDFRLFIIIIIAGFLLSIYKEFFWLKKLTQGSMLVIFLFVLLLSAEEIIYYNYDRWFFAT